MSSAFSQHVLQYLFVLAQVCQQLLQLPVLLFQNPQPANLHTSGTGVSLSACGRARAISSAV